MKSSSAAFDSVCTSREVKRAIRAMGFCSMTDVQRRAIPKVLEGKDLLVTARTGSGKTLAFLVPAAEEVGRRRMDSGPVHTTALVITPTRELAVQIQQVSAALTKAAGAKTVALVGGTKRAAEAQEISAGCDVVVATPGRLLDHLENTEGFSLKHVKLLVLDEADRILEGGFERDLLAILKFLPDQRQTLLFSATQTGEVERLAKLSLRAGAEMLSVHQDEQTATNAGLEQRYVICPEGRRFSFLFGFLEERRDKKVIVFFSTCSSVAHHSDFFALIGWKVHALHGQMKQGKRAKAFAEFSSQGGGVLFTTDVSARGLDIPGVDWIVQYDPPTDPKEYIHRVGRTARAGARGKALLCLSPCEKAFVEYMATLKVYVEEQPLGEERDVSAKLINTVKKNRYLVKSAQSAFRACIQAYAVHQLKDIFDVGNIELNGLAHSFGLEAPPSTGLGEVLLQRKSKWDGRPRERPGTQRPK